MAKKTLKVKATRSVAGRGFAIAPGETKELPKEIAEDLVKAGHAEYVKERSRKAQDDSGETATAD